MNLKEINVFEDDIFVCKMIKFYNSKINQLTKIFNIVASYNNRTKEAETCSAKLSVSRVLTITNFNAC